MKNRLQNEGKIDAEMCDFLFFSRKGHFAKTAIILGLFAKKQGSASQKKRKKCYNAHGKLHKKIDEKGTGKRCEKT